MDYELIPIESGNAGSSHMLRGTIVDTRVDVKTYAVNLYGQDTWIIRADVDIDDYGLVEGIIIFYHCQYSEKAGRAVFPGLEEDPFEGDSLPYLAMEGSPFVKDDRVVVANYGSAGELSADDMKVVGYEDGLPRQCVFQFRITRDDGTVIDKDLLTIIRIQQEIEGNPGHYQTLAYTTSYSVGDPNWTQDGDTWHYKEDGYYSREFSYNTVTQIWTVPFMVGPYIVPKYGKDFWVELTCTDSVTCMYAAIENRGYVYKSADFHQAEHAAVSKFYEVKVPYYKIISTDRTPLPYPAYCTTRWCWDAGGGFDNVVVKSSIPYTVWFKAPDVVSHTPRGSYWGKWVDNCLLHGPDCAACQVEADRLGNRWCATDPIPIAIDESANVAIVCSNGVSSSNLTINPIDSEQVVTPDANVVQTNTHTLTLSYSGSGNYTLTRNCAGGGSINFPLDFRVFHLDVYISITPDI